MITTHQQGTLQANHQNKCRQYTFLKATETYRRVLLEFCSGKWPAVLSCDDTAANVWIDLSQGEGKKTCFGFKFTILTTCMDRLENTKTVAEITKLFFCLTSGS